MSDLEQELARLLSTTVDEARGWLSSADSQLASQYGSKIAAWKEALQLEYGCWCGPGNRCEEDVDAMDSCCHQHDTAYDALDLDFDSMWTAAAFVKSQVADQALYDCVSSAEEPADQEGRDYRAVLLEAFKERVAIAAWLKDL